MSWYRDAHRSHWWSAADDVIECGRCAVRIYNDEATDPCPYAAERTVDE